MEQSREMDLMDGFNMYNTDEEAQASSLSKHGRYCLLFVFFAILFVCGVWTVDSVLDHMDAESGARDASETGSLRTELEKLVYEEPAQKKEPKAFQCQQGGVYFERCVPVTPAACHVEACFSDDMDLGINGSVAADDIDALLLSKELQLEMSLERRCLSVPSLAHPQTRDRSGAPIRCAGDLTQVHEANAPPEIHESFEWTSDVDETIFLELWGGGGGGAGSFDVSSADAPAWICGGGGGAASALSLVWELQEGWAYRIEIGKGGRGGLPFEAGGEGSGSRFFQRATESKSWQMIAEAGGGSGGGKLHTEYLFSPGGRGGEAVVFNVSRGCTLPGLDGQSSRSNLELQPKVPLPGYGDEGFRLKSGSRIPCTGKDGLHSGRPYGWQCFQKPDFFLTCTADLHCLGAVQSVPQNFSSRHHQLFHGAPAGGLAPHGSGAVKRQAGRGGDGRCASLEPDKVPDGQVLPRLFHTTGSPGVGGLASIRGCQVAV